MNFHPPDGAALAAGMSILKNEKPWQYQSHGSKRLMPMVTRRLLSRRLPAGFVTSLTVVTDRGASAEHFD